MRRLDADSGLGWVVGTLTIVATAAAAVSIASAASPGPDAPLIGFVCACVGGAAIGMLFPVVLAALTLRGVRHMLEQTRAEIIHEVTGRPIADESKPGGGPRRDDDPPRDAPAGT